MCTFVNFIKENEPKGMPSMLRTLGLVKMKNDFYQNHLYHLLFLDADIHFVDKICLSLPDESPPSETKIDMNDISSEELNSSIIKFCLMEVTPHRKE